MKSYFNEYLESEMNAIKIQGEVDSLAIAFKYVIKTLTDEQAKLAKTFIEMVTIALPIILVGLLLELKEWYNNIHY
jgi:flagellar biosynthesis protein FliR